jgi:hypothetical protein
MILTISNNSLTSFSDSPRYLEVRVEEETLKKVVPHSVATALANMVFPVPGGPTINTPFHGRRIPCNGNHNKHTGSKLTEDLGHKHLILYLKNYKKYATISRVISKGVYRPEFHPPP